jgi:4-amino-4-deoxy-L-arabinose transferase-like glycosyltransferase
MKKAPDTYSNDDIRKIIAKANKHFLLSPLMATFVLIGPIAWFFIDLSDHRYDRLPVLFVSSLVVMALTAVLWMIFFWNKADEKELNEKLSRMDSENDT